LRTAEQWRLVSELADDPNRLCWRFPLIIAAALKLRQEHFVVDGETVVLGPEGV
jgi:hypothetical protein